MPASEDCRTAERLRESLQGRLVPMARFCLLEGENVHYTEGIAHRGAKDGIWDPSCAAFFDGKDVKMLWADPEKRPWRMLDSLLSFLSVEKHQCIQLKTGIPRLSLKDSPAFGIWSGGVRVSANSGEQRVGHNDDFVESEIWLDLDIVKNEAWFLRLEAEMGSLERQAKTLFASVCGYYRQLNADGTGAARKSAGAFWEKAEALFQEMLDACAEESALPTVRRKIASLAEECYDRHCPARTARQIAAWAACRPAHGIDLA